MFNFQKEKWIFDIPKLLDLKDNYIKDLQASGKKPSNHKEEEVEAKEEVEADTNKAQKKDSPKKKTPKKKIYSENFEIWWSIFKGNPTHGKGDKSKVFVEFNKVPESDYDNLMVGTKNYGETTEGSYKGVNFLKEEIWKLHIQKKIHEPRNNQQNSNFDRNNPSFQNNPSIKEMAIAASEAVLNEPIIEMNPQQKAINEN